ncbi:hypothetical protein [Kutzneria kofuensis]|uniref:hypothetical protein n=1 Tax=Kutzneria kofuensis TaxID=103725 RepID=UPI0031EFB01F
MVAIVFAALYLWLAFKLKAGRNWARVTLAVLTVLHLVTLFLQGAVTLSYRGHRDPGGRRGVELPSGVQRLRCRAPAQP